MKEVKDPEVRKAEIMDVSARLFASKGYLKTTTQDIISEANISRGLLYYYFKSKEDILFCLVEQYTEPLLKKIENLAYDENKTAIEKVRKLMEVTAITDSETTEERKVIQESVSLEQNHYMMDCINHKLSNGLTKCFTHIIDQGNKENSFDVHYPKEVSKFLMTGYCFVSCDIKRYSNNIETLKLHLFAFKELIQLTLASKENLFND